MPTDVVVVQGLSRSVRENWGWFLALGIVLIIAGVLAIGMPLVTSLALGTLLAIVFVIAGVVEIIQSFRVRDWGGFLWNLLVGVVLLIGGIAMWVNPAVGSIAITWVIAAVFIVKGVFQLMFAFRLRPHDGWGWILASGIIALLAGLAILFNWPLSGVTIPGLLAGISLLMTGWSYFWIGLLARRSGV